MITKKIVVFCWGYSIHAKRRIEILASLSDVEVSVISTYAYDISGVSTFLLTQKGNYPHALAIEPIKKILPSFLFKKILPLLKLFCDLCVLAVDVKIARGYLKTYKPDIVWLQTLLYPNYTGVLAAMDAKIFITFWNGDVTWHAKLNTIEKYFKDFIFRYCVRKAHVVTVNSKTAFDACVAKNIEPNKISLIRYPGVDTSIFMPIAMDEAKQRLRLDAMRRYILCPRGLGGYLNSDIIVEAAGIVCKKYDDVVFLFISTVGMELWSEHCKIGAELGVGQFLRHDGGVEWELMPFYYSASSVMVSISSYDSQPNCMLEAMACKTPIVAGDIEATREWIRDKENGCLVEPRSKQELAEAIEYILQSSDFVEKSTQINYRLVMEKASLSNARQLLKDVIKR